MKLFYLILLMVASMSLQCSCYIVQEQVPCENVRSLRWAQIDFLDTCFINDATISSPDVSCSEPRNVSVKGLSLCQNKNINYLPVKIARSFPNLLGYCAAECNIKAISKENFRKLVHLVELLLLRNKIEVILRDTFEDLTSLERIDLREEFALNFFLTLKIIFLSFIRSKHDIKSELGSIQEFEIAQNNFYV